MKSSANLKATEERLEEIRKAAANAADVAGTIKGRARSPQTLEERSYYGQPALKAPVWTWEVPLYFFFGGVAGMASCIAFVAQLFHRAELDAWEQKLDRAHEVCTLPEEPPVEEMHRFLIGLRMTGL